MITQPACASTTQLGGTRNDHDITTTHQQQRGRRWERSTQVLRGIGVQAEVTLPFAALHRSDPGRLPKRLLRLRTRFRLMTNRAPNLGQV